MTGTAPLRRPCRSSASGKLAAKRAGRAQVVAAEHVERRGAHVADQRRGDDERDGEDGQGEGDGRLAEICQPFSGKPPDGKRWRLMAKTVTSRMPSQNTGMAMPSCETTEIAAPYQRSDSYRGDDAERNAR